MKSVREIVLWKHDLLKESLCDTYENEEEDKIGKTVAQQIRYIDFAKLKF